MEPFGAMPQPPAYDDPQVEADLQDGTRGIGGGRGLPNGTFVKNTFLEFAEDEDPWFITPTPLRQKTDSLLDRSSHSLQLEMGNERTPSMPSGIPQAAIPGPSALPPASSILTSGIGPLVGRRPSEGRPRTLADLIPGDIATQASGRPLSRRPTSGSFEAQIAEEWPEEEPPSPTVLMKPSDAKQLVQQYYNEAEEESSDEAGSGEDTIISSHIFPSGGDPSQEVQTARDVAEQGGGLSGYTTVMLREIPTGYSQRKLMREVNSMGFLGKYDFLYLPMDPRSKASRGFAFINFVCPATAEIFYRKVHGDRLRHFYSERALAVVPADVQGFEANATHFASLQGSKRKKRVPHNRPLFFRKLPAELAGAGEEAEIEGLDAPVAPLIAAACPATQAGYPLPARVQADYMQPQPPWPELPPPAAAPARPRPRFCGYCGAPKQADFQFCPYCGGRVLA